MYVREILVYMRPTEEGSGAGVTTKGDQESKRLAVSILVQQFQSVMYLGDTELKTGNFYLPKCLLFLCVLLLKMKITHKSVHTL